MKRKRTIQLALILSVLLLTHFRSISQNTIQESEEIKSTIPNIEKVYLHTDRSYYNIGESLWYKAYSVYAYTNVLFDHSNLLYVELVSPDSKIVARNITRLEEGLGHGDMKLTDSIGVSAGIYQLRAYTNWMRNFGDDFVFKKEIEIIDINKKETEKESSDLNTSEGEIKEDFIVDDGAKPINFQFFPEGGSLVEGVLSMVAFKATDTSGNPIAVSGSVFDINKKMVARIKSTHDGMGKFRLTPSENQTYTAEIRMPSGEKMEVTIPKSEKTGYVMSIKSFKGKHIVTIATNEETIKQRPEAPLTLVCTTRGITYFEGTQSIGSKTHSFLLPSEDIPDGISQITLYDENSKPYCERLVYIEKNHELDVSITLEKNHYSPKEKTTLKVSAKTRQGIPLVASFSMSAIDENGMNDNQDYGSNICSYFLMESDIKGKINKPGYYFNHSNPKRLYDLDLLLLTQGWRDFLWKKLPVVKDSTHYKQEKGIKISGIVKKLLGKDPKENCNVRLILINKEGKTMMLNDTTDGNGRFQFENLVFTGKSTMMLNTQNEKGKNRGMFLLDSIFEQPIAVDYKNNTSFPSLESSTLKEQIYKKHVFFDVPVDNRLNEVVINAKKKETRKSKYGTADHTYIPKEKGPNFTNIHQLIQFSIPGVTVSGSVVKFARYNGPALILIDDAIAEMEDLSFVIPDDVAKIESLNSSKAAIFGSRGANGVIIIYTKEGKVGSKKRKKLHSITSEIQGFYNTRFFYSPNYDKPIKDLFEEEKADIRNTLYWNPYVHTNENGVTEVSYFNSEVHTNVKVTMEGITDTGIPIVVKTNYSIEE